MAYVLKLYPVSPSCAQLYKYLERLRILQPVSNRDTLCPGKFIELVIQRHDVSWGTKGSDKDDALPSVSSKKPGGAGPAVVEDVEKVQEDIDAAFKETVTRAVAPLVKKEVVEKPNADVSAVLRWQPQQRV